jgi:hypothetical protein
MEGEPIVELEQVHLPGGGVAPRGPEHVELGQPQLPRLLRGYVPTCRQEQREVFHPRRHASEEKLYDNTKPPP